MPGSGGAGTGTSGGRGISGGQGDLGGARGAPGGSLLSQGHAGARPPRFGADITEPRLSGSVALLMRTRTKNQRVLYKQLASPLREDARNFSVPDLSKRRRVRPRPRAVKQGARLGASAALTSTAAARRERQQLCVTPAGEAPLPPFPSLHTGAGSPPGERPAPQLVPAPAASHAWAPGTGPGSGSRVCPCAPPRPPRPRPAPRLAAALTARPRL